MEKQKQRQSLSIPKKILQKKQRIPKTKTTHISQNEKKGKKCNQQYYIK